MLKKLIALELAGILIVGAIRAREYFGGEVASGKSPATSPVAIQCTQSAPVGDPGTAIGEPSTEPAVAPASRGSSETSEEQPLPALRRPRIVVRKAAGRLTVYDRHRPVKKYRVAVGAGEGDKIREGDQCTPEGEFYVCVRNRQSQYVLSLGLSYPNIEDAERGRRDGLIGRQDYRAILVAIRAHRQPPWNTALGGEIMIHGRRDGRDSTLGCIAMNDQDIRELYPAIPLGTPVTILP